MLSFATEFPVHHEHRGPAFSAVLRKWLLGSPHTVLRSSDLAGFASEGEWEATKGTERLETLTHADGEDQSVGLRYTRTDASLEWVTTVVFSRTSASTWVGIRVSCESTHPAVRLPPAKKPVLVRTILSELQGGRDGALVVQNAPYHLGNVDVELAANLIRGTAGCRLPIVYVSAGFLGRYLVDGVKLASDLSGMAHVVVEPNRPFSLRLRLEVASENVYGGTVGIYWPDGSGRRSFFLGHEYASEGALQQAIIEEVRSALVNRRPLNRCTWFGVRQSVSRSTFAALRAAGSQEVDRFADEFDKELDAKQEQLDAAEREIARLQAEVRKFEARIPLGVGVTLTTGSEQDLFPGEIAGIVRDALSDSTTRVPADSRRAHVLSAIVSATPVTSEADRIRDELKSLLRGSSTLDAKLRRGLERLGFSINEDGKHIKIVFQGDDRYTFALPKSGSDRRGGLNAATDIGRLLF